MSIPRILSAVLSGGTALACLGSAHAATQPVPGIYDQYQVVTSSSSKPAGLTGCNAVGAEVGGYFGYPGPAKTGAYTSGAIESAATGSMKMQICKFPVTPGAGATTYSGTLSCTNTYENGSPPATYSESFAWTITYVDANSWLVKKTITYPVTGGTCTEVRNQGLQRTGK